jgi:hypothetical protein
MVDDFFNALYDYGGLGIMRCGDGFNFLFLGKPSGYIIYTHSTSSQSVEKLTVPDGSHSARFIEKLVNKASQLFYVKYSPELELCTGMFGAGREILYYYPEDNRRGSCGYDENKKEKANADSI